MSLKLIAPLAGIIGTIASVVGVSTSNSRPEKDANPIPSHLWKVEKVETITLETKCQVEGGGGTRDNYSLKLTLGLEENKSKELLQSQNVSIGAEIEFKAEGDWQAIQDFQDSDGDVQMKVTTGKQKSNLKIEMTGKKLGLGSGRGKDSVKKSFVCNNSGVKPVGQGWWHNGKDVFTSEMLPLGNRQLISSGVKPISFSVSLKSCEDGESGTVATCDLKLTTGSDLDWSTKVSAKAKFTIF